LAAVEPLVRRCQLLVPERIAPWIQPAHDTVLGSEPKLGAPGIRFRAEDRDEHFFLIIAALVPAVR
jgi:hypothetical protein